METSKQSEEIQTENTIFTPHQPKNRELSVNVPTPETLPKRIDVSHLPHEVTKNSVLESVLDQNDDLMARLSVTLRRISSLEEQVVHFKNLEAETRSEYENLKDQVLVLRAKARCVQERQDDYDQRYNKLKSELEFLQIKYEEEIKEFEIKLSNSYDETEKLVTAEQKKAEALTQSFEETIDQREALIAEITERHSQHSVLKQSEIDQLEKSLKRYTKYGQKLSTIAHLRRTELARLQICFNDLEQTTESTEKKLIEQHESATEELHQQHSKEIDQLEFERSQLIQKVEESTNYIQTQAKTHRQEQEDLTSSYEATLAELRKKVEEMTNKTKDHQLLLAKNADLNNQLVVVERSLDDQQGRHQAEVSSLQESLAEYRSTAKRVTLESQQQTKDNERFQTELKTLKESNSTLTDQVESLQVLWKQSQNELEVQSTRNESLQKLNQQLSVNLNDYRKQIKELKAELEKKDFSTSQKVEEIRKQLKAAALVHEQDFIEEVKADTNKQLVKATESAEESKKDENFRPELMNKIDDLIVEIQSGFK